MWKTNKWVPEWVIRRAIAHLHAGPPPPCRCAYCRSRKSERWLGELASHRGWQTGGKPLPSATGPVLRCPTLLSQLPIPCPCIFKLKTRSTLCHPFVRLLSSLSITKAFFFPEDLRCVPHKYLLLQLFLWAWVTSSPTLFTLVTPFEPHWYPHFSGMYPARFCLRASAIASFQPKTFSPLLSRVHCLTSFRSLLKCTHQ